MKRKRDWKRLVPWILIGIYVVSPIDPDPGLPFTDLAAIGIGLWNERKQGNRPMKRTATLGVFLVLLAPVHPQPVPSPRFCT